MTALKTIEEPSRQCYYMRNKEEPIMSTREMRQQTIVDFNEYKTAYISELEELNKARSRRAHSMVMNSVISALTLNGIDVRILKGMNILSDVVQDMIEQHLAKNGNLPDTTPPDNSAA
jgi:hypothetical protein